MLNRIELKHEAKGIIRNATVSAYLMALLYLVISVGLEFLAGYVNGSFITYINNALPGAPIPSFLIHEPFSPVVTIFISVMTWLLSSVLVGGWSLYHLGIRRKQAMGYATLFDGFSFVGRLVGVSLAVSVLVTLGSMLFVLPGFILGYMYRFAVYNLCENPEIGVLTALRMSRLQTRGHKMDLFVLDISFFGWSILNAVTFGISAIWVMPYVEQTNVGYFQQLKRMSGIGWIPPEERPHDDTFHSNDPFGPAV